jgi:DNA-binding NarL/FixJ family response regulator
VARLIYAGRTVNEISQEIGKSPKTIEKYRTDMYEKLGVKNAIELVKFIAVHNLTF